MNSPALHATSPGVFLGAGISEGLPYSRYCFVLRALEGGHLPRWKASMLRGALGMQLRRIVCTFRGRECQSCVLRTACPYPALFERTAVMPRDLAAVNPYVVHVPDQSTEIEFGQTLVAQVTLFGPAHSYLPHLVYAIERTANEGLGSRRIRFELIDVQRNGSHVYKPGETAPLVANPELIMPWPDDAATAEAQLLTLRLETPLRVRQDNKLARSFSLALLVGAAVRRIQNLWRCTGSEPPHIDLPALLQVANQLTPVESSVHWEEQYRFSSRQKQRMSLGGLVGEACLSGNAAPILPVLHVGTITHVGKQCSFGNGKYTIEVKAYE